MFLGSQSLLGSSLKPLVLLVRSAQKCCTSRRLGGSGAGRGAMAMGPGRFHGDASPLTELSLGQRAESSAQKGPVELGSCMKQAVGVVGVSPQDRTAGRPLVLLRAGVACAGLLGLRAAPIAPGTPGSPCTAVAALAGNTVGAARKLGLPVRKCDCRKVFYSIIVK